MHIDKEIWARHPGVAAAVLGYAEGRLGIPCKPPKYGRNEYLREYTAGVEASARLKARAQVVTNLRTLREQGLSGGTMADIAAI